MTVSSTAKVDCGLGRLGVRCALPGASQSQHTSLFKTPLVIHSLKHPW